MTKRSMRPLVTMAVGALLGVMALASAGSVGAAIPDRTFQVVGCDIGDYTCYYHKLGGTPSSYYCNNNVYTCTNGVPDNAPQYAANVSPYCGDGGAAGCLTGSPLFVGTTIVNGNGSGLSSNVVVASNFLNDGSSGPHVVKTP